MLALFLAIMAAVWLIAAEDEAGAVAYNSRVHSTVIFTRSGERTPAISSLEAPVLTSYGAQQMAAVGRAFRDRYMGEVSSSDNPLSIHRIVGVSNYSIENLQLYVLTPNNPALIASAQAFVQGLYPPFTLNQAHAGLLDPASVLANSTYVEYPLGGYQYAQIESFTDMDPNIIYLAGHRNCISQETSAVKYVATDEFAETQRASADMYTKVGSAALNGVLDPPQWDYMNAYPIYEYLDYRLRHDTSTNALFNQDAALAAAFDQIRSLASQQLWAYYGDGTVDDGIRTVAGQTVAAKVLGQMATAISSNGSTAKINLLFGDHEPFVSFFSLAGLGELNSNFYGLPDYGSSMVFELFSLGRSSDDTTFPSEDELWVRFYFRNGSVTSDDLQAFPIFSRGPSETDIRWKDFAVEMGSVMKSSMVDWCNTCSAVTLFCYAVNSTGAVTLVSAGSTSSPMNAQVAGVIGAGVTLGFVGLVFGLAMVFGRVRFHRVTKSKKSEIGGFKGSAKMASDADLVIPGAAPIPFGASVDDSKARERVGSWELKNKEFGRPVTREDDAISSVNPFADPVRPDERV